MLKSSRFTKTERSWILYDWANSVYATNMLAAIFPIYFGSVCQAAGADNVVLWSLGTSASTLLVALLAPFLGALADHRGYKKKLFTLFLVLGVGFTLFNAFTDNYVGMLVGYALSHVGFSGANLFYDAFITDVTEPKRMDKVSSWGYAMGYVGGSTIAFLISIAILLVMGMENITALKLVLVLTGLWWLLFSLPMLKNVRQTHCIERPAGQLLRSALGNLRGTFKSILGNRGMLLFILAYFFYIDGVSTVISVSTSYGSILGLDATGMIMALLVTQIVAVPCSILFGRLAEKRGAIPMLTLGVLVYVGICILGFFMGFIIEQSGGSAQSLATAQGLFWALALLVGTVQGGIQAISRSYFGKLVPPSRSGEYFGFFDIFGKFAAVMGPLLVAGFKGLTGRDSVGVLSVILLFALGFVLLLAGRKHFARAEEAAKKER